MISDLDLSKSGMVDRGLQLLACGLLRAAGASKLSALRLACNKLRLEDGECISAMRELLGSPDCPLTVLDLGSNRLGNDGAAVLAELIQGNSSLVEVDISNNSITAQGLCALGPVLADHPSMKQVRVWGNRFDSAACAAWLPATRKLDLDIAITEVDGLYQCVRA